MVDDALGTSGLAFYWLVLWHFIFFSQSWSDFENVAPQTLNMRLSILWHWQNLCVQGQAQVYKWLLWLKGHYMTDKPILETKIWLEVSCVKCGDIDIDDYLC